MFKSFRNLFTLTILLGLSLVSFAQKDTSAIKTLSRGADIILTGKVDKTESGWNSSRTRIYTKVTLEVDEYLKGAKNAPSLEITYPGGEVGDVGELYSHMPRFTEKEEVLVFLKKSKRGTAYKVLHGESGKITLVNDERTGEKVTSSNVRLHSLKAAIKSYLSNEK